MSVTFKLKCVGCGMVEERPAAAVKNDDGDPPMCETCFMPMVCLSVVYHQGRKPKGPRIVMKGDRNVG